MLVAIAGLAAMRPLLPHAPILREAIPVFVADDLPWAGGTYVLDVRSGEGAGTWPRLDERHWDEGLGRILADGAFAVRIALIADAADLERTAHIAARLGRELPQARVAVLLGGAAAVPADYRWRSR